MAYTAFSVVFGEQPSAAKWNTLGSNDAHFYSFLGDSTTGFPIQHVFEQLNTSSTTTSEIPVDDTIPQIGEGAEVLTATITPKSASSTIVVKAHVYGTTGSTATGVIIALFRDATANAIAASMSRPGVDIGVDVNVGCEVSAAATSATTFRLRVGSTSSGNAVRWGGAGGRFFGDIPKVWLELVELRA